MFARSVVLVFAISFAGNVAALLTQMPSVWSILGALVGWYCADLVSGVIHFSLDYLPCPAGRGLGDLYNYPGSRGGAEYVALRRRVMGGVSPWGRLLFDFKCHHPRPEVLGRRDTLMLVQDSLLYGGIPASLAMNALCYTTHVPSWLVAGLMTFVLGSVLSQFAHSAVHRDDNGWVVRGLQRSGLLIDQAAHDVHHANLDRDFATLSGWSNPVGNRLFRWCRGRGWLSDDGLEPR